MNKARAQKFYGKLIKAGLACVGLFFIWTTVVLNNIDTSEYKVNSQADELEILLPLHWKKAALFIDDLPKAFDSKATTIANALLVLQSLSIKEALKTQKGCTTFSHAMQNYQQEITSLLDDIKIQVRAKKIPMPPKQWFDFAKESSDVTAKLQMLSLVIENYNQWINGDSAQYINFIFYNRKAKPSFDLDLKSSGLEGLRRYDNDALHP